MRRMQSKSQNEEAKSTRSNAKCTRCALATIRNGYEYPLVQEGQHSVRVPVNS